MPSLSIQVTRLFLSGLERISPRLSSRLAFRLFRRTPSRKPNGPKAVQAFQSGKRALAFAKTQRLRTPSGSVGLYVLSAPGQPVTPPRVLIVHGWGSRAEYLASLALGLNAAGADVVILDLPGHGSSSGRRLDLRLAAEAIIAADRRFGGFDGVVGHSFGGASVMMALGSMFDGLARLRTKKVVLIGSPSSMADVFADFAKVVGLGASSMSALNDHVFQLIGRSVEDLDGVEVARRERVPLLVVHAEDDKEVSSRHAHRYIGAHEHVRHLWANGHGHRRIVNAADVIAAVADFLFVEEKSDMARRKRMS